MDLSKIYPPRPTWVHKGDFGNVMVVSGSKLYSGAATLAAVAALRAGCDMVTVCAPQRAAEVASHKFPDLMTFPLKGDFLAKKHVDDIFDIAVVRRINSVVLGCGLGRREETAYSILKLIAKLTVPIVLDADGLRAVAGNPRSVHDRRIVMTPHAGELAILLGQRELPHDFEARLLAAKQAAGIYQCVIVLKGPVDVITDGVSTITNNSGSPQMTKGGFGDTLAGICAALLARGTGMFEAAQAAAYINGRAGELAAEQKGEGALASDIFETIPEVINRV